MSCREIISSYMWIFSYLFFYSDFFLIKREHPMRYLSEFYEVYSCYWQKKKKIIIFSTDLLHRNNVSKIKMPWLIHFDNFYEMETFLHYFCSYFPIFSQVLMWNFPVYLLDFFLFLDTKVTKIKETF